MALETFPEGPASFGVFPKGLGSWIQTKICLQVSLAEILPAICTFEKYFVLSETPLSLRQLGTRVRQKPWTLQAAVRTLGQAQAFWVLRINLQALGLKPEVFSEALILCSVPQN